MKQIEKCPFIENNEKECDVPPYKPCNLKGGNEK